jgi:hypothetical protein
MKIKQLLEKKIHFSVIQYYSWLITQPTETHKIYELLYIDPKPNKEPKMIFEEMDEESINYFKENIDQLKKVLDNQDGSVYEFMNFKEYKEILIVSPEQKFVERLSIYLPYELKCQVNKKVLTLSKIDADGNCQFVELPEKKYHFKKFKPILKKFTKEQLKQIWEEQKDWNPQVQKHIPYVGDFKGLLADIKSDQIRIGTLKFLAKNHFDIYNLSKQ